MYLESYEQRHKSVLDDIISAHGVPQDDIDTIPATGICVFERGELIAFAALRSVEGNLAILEGLITNPTAPGDMRSTAIDLAVEYLMKLADNNQTTVIAWTSDVNTIVRSDKHGFVRVPKTLIARSPNQR